MTRILSLMLGYSVLAVPSALAQEMVPPLADRVKIGTLVTATDESGRVTTGKVQSVSDEMISLSRRGGVEAIPVGVIVRIEKPDRLVNGALIGMTIGIVSGIVGGTLDGQGRGDRDAFIIVSTLGNTVVWTALGTAVDAIFNNKRTLYERGGRTQASLAPIVGSGARGAAVRLAW